METTQTFDTITFDDPISTPDNVQQLTRHISREDLSKRNEELKDINLSYNDTIEIIEEGYAELLFLRDKKVESYNLHQILNDNILDIIVEYTHKKNLGRILKLYIFRDMRYEYLNFSLLASKLRSKNLYSLILPLYEKFRPYIPDKYLFIREAFRDDYQLFKKYIGYFPSDIDENLMLEILELEDSKYFFLKNHRIFPMVSFTEHDIAEIFSGIDRDSDEYIMRIETLMDAIYNVESVPKNILADLILAGYLRDVILNRLIEKNKASFIWALNTLKENADQLIAFAYQFDGLDAEVAVLLKKYGFEDLVNVYPEKFGIYDNLLEVDFRNRP